jgi:F-type H+-transporting ATPase subunit b
MNLNLTLVAQALVFLAFIWFNVKFVWPVLTKMIQERQKTIADGLAAAERGTKALEEASSKSEDTLKAARSQAQEILSSATRQASQTIEQAKGQAQTEADRIKEAARAEAAREITAAKEVLRKQVGELAVVGASKILKREIDAKAHGDVLKELAARI